MAQPTSLKIGIVLDTSLDPMDGVQQYVVGIGEWLRQQGNDVHYLVGQTEKRQLPNIHSLAKNVTVTFNGNKTTIPLWVSKRKIKTFISSQKFDVLHVQMPHHPLMAQRIILAAQPETAVIGTFHILPYTWKETLGTKILGKFLKRSLERFDAIFAVSEPARVFAELSFKIKASVLPNVVNLSWYKDRLGTPREASETTTIVFLGRLVERKGALQLLQAVAVLPKSVQNNIVVKIGGKGELLPELQKYAAEAQISHLISFVGFVAEEDKPAFLHQADIAVFPSMGGESFGIVLLEAMAAQSGVVLGGNNPGYASVLAPWPETLVDPLQTHLFAQQLEKFITNVGKRRELHHQQQAAISQYDIATVGPKLFNSYQIAIAKRTNKQDNTSK